MTETGDRSSVLSANLHQPVSRGSSKEPRDPGPAPCWLQLSSVAQSCLTLGDPVDHSPPGLPVHHRCPCWLGEEEIAGLGAPLPRQSPQHSQWNPHRTSAGSRRQVFPAHGAPSLLGAQKEGPSACGWCTRAVSEPATDVNQSLETRRALGQEQP